MMTKQPGDPEAATLRLLVDRMRETGLDPDTLAPGEGDRIICYDFLSWIQAHANRDRSSGAMDLST